MLPSRFCTPAPRSPSPEGCGSSAGLRSSTPPGHKGRSVKSAAAEERARCGTYLHHASAFDPLIFEYMPMAHTDQGHGSCCMCVTGRHCADNVYSTFGRTTYWCACRLQQIAEHGAQHGALPAVRPAQHLHAATPPGQAIKPTAAPWPAVDASSATVQSTAAACNAADTCSDPIAATAAAAQRPLSPTGRLVKSKPLTASVPSQSPACATSVGTEATSAASAPMPASSAQPHTADAAAAGVASTAQTVDAPTNTNVTHAPAASTKQPPSPGAVQQSGNKQSSSPRPSSPRDVAHARYEEYRLGRMHRDVPDFKRSQARLSAPAATHQVATLKQVRNRNSEHHIGCQLVKRLFL